MIEFMTEIKKYRKAIFILIAIYTLVTTAIILISTNEYNHKYPLDYQKVTLEDNWELVTDQVVTNTSISLPFNDFDHTAKTIDLVTTIPELGYYDYVLETSIIQKELQVYVDEKIVYKTDFKPITNLQTSPGSGNLYIRLPQDSAGKQLRLRYTNSVAIDHSGLRVVSVSNGNYNPYLSIPHGNPIFFTSTSIALLGFVLLFAAFIFFRDEAHFRPLAYIATFAIGSSLWILCNTKLMQFFTNNLVFIHNLEYICYFTMPISLWGFIGRSWGNRSKVAMGMFICSIVFFIFTLTMKLFGIADFFTFLNMYHSLFLFHISATIYVLYENRKRRFDSFKLLCLGLAALGIFSFYDLVQYYFGNGFIVIPNSFILGLDLMIIFFVLSFVYSSKEQLEESIENRMYRSLAFSDALTQLSNRMRFEDDMQECEKNLSQYNQIALVIIDINNLKYVNDTFGHLAGDQLIQIIAAEIKVSFQIDNNGYRIGGDEFAIILKNESDAFINAKLNYFKKRLSNHKEKFPVNAAYGYQLFQKYRHHNLQEVFKEADNRMYENKLASKHEHPIVNQ